MTALAAATAAYSSPAGGTTAISIRGLGKAYTINRGIESQTTLAEQALARIKNPFHRAQTETFWALRDIDLDIQQGEVVGIIGRNGAGKSTLLKLLSRITAPTEGRIEINGRVGSLLEVGTGFHPELTGRENIFLNGAVLGMTRPEIKREFDAIVEFAGVERFLETPVKRYSSGMYVRLAFAVAAHLRTEVLIVDEVLAVGDAEFQKKCLGKMQDVASGQGRTVLFVSHNLRLIETICNRTAVLCAGELIDISTTCSAIQTYLADRQSSEYYGDQGAIRSARVQQNGKIILLRVDWLAPEKVKLPNLGFVIEDVHGRPIAGSNPRRQGIEQAPSFTDHGTIEVRIARPRLIDGTYGMSLWLGDGVHNFAELPNCLRFEVQGMGGKHETVNPQIGAVCPSCEFAFASSSNDAGGAG